LDRKKITLNAETAPIVSGQAKILLKKNGDIEIPARRSTSKAAATSHGQGQQDRGELI